MNTIGTILGSKLRLSEPRKGLICRRTRKDIRGGAWRARAGGCAPAAAASANSDSQPGPANRRSMVFGIHERNESRSTCGGHSRRIREQGCGAAGCRRCADCCGVQSDDRHVCVASHLFPPSVPNAEPNTASPMMVATAVRLRPGIRMASKPSTSGRELWSGVND